MSRRLVVNADDLGLTEGVNRAVGHAHRNGIVTSTSVLAVGRAFDHAVALLRDTPSLDVGAHLALVGEDPPLLSAAEIPTLVDKRGALPLSYRTVVARGVTHRIDPDDVRRELGAQLDKIVGAGLAPTHLDTHQHTHLWPTVGAVLVELASQYGVPRVRRPRSHRRTPVGGAVNVLSARLGRRLLAAGLITTDDYAGLDEAGRMDAFRLERALVRSKATTLEVNVHPGEAADPDAGRFAWRYRWAEELALLTDPATAGLLDGYDLVPFSALTAHHR